MTFLGTINYKGNDEMQFVFIEKLLRHHNAHEFHNYHSYIVLRFHMAYMHEKAMQATDLSTWVMGIDGVVISKLSRPLTLLTVWNCQV